MDGWMDGLIGDDCGRKGPMHFFSFEQCAEQAEQSTLGISGR